MNERLEESISVIRNMVKIFHEQQGIGFQLSEHAEYVIQQAERVEELEKELNGTEHRYGYKQMYGMCNRDYATLNSEKNRYKQAIKHINNDQLNDEMFVK